MTSTVLIESQEGWAALRGEWDELVANSTFPSVFLTFDYLFAAFRAFHAAHSEPLLIVVRNQTDKLIGIAPFRRSRRSLRGFTLTVVEYLVTWEIDKPYVIARKGQEGRCWQEIFGVLQSDVLTWDVLRLVELPDHLVGARTLLRMFHAPSYRCDTTNGPASPHIDLTMGWEAFLRRHKRFKKSLKKLAALPDGYGVRTYRSPDVISSGLNEYLELEELSWKHGVHGLAKNPSHLNFYRSVIEALSREGRASIHILKSGQASISGIICCEFQDTVYVHHTVYNPAYGHVSPGTIFMGLVLGEYMKAGVFKTADLLCGFAHYYLPWASRIVSTSEVKVYRLSAKVRVFLALQRLKERAGLWRASAQRQRLGRRSAPVHNPLLTR